MIYITEDTIFLGNIITGTIASIELRTSTALKPRFILGFGSVTLFITADTKTKTGCVKLFLCFV
jgi:hypothetical protein